MVPAEVPATFFDVFQAPEPRFGVERGECTDVHDSRDTYVFKNKILDLIWGIGRAHV